MKKPSIFEATNFVFLSLLALVAVFPFYYIVVLSFSDAVSFSGAGFFLWPTSFDTSAYSYLLTDSNFLRGTFNTLFITAVGVLYNMTLSTTLAYGLSKKRLFGRNTFLNIILFTMFFSGGLIPFYLLMTQTLHLGNSIWALILPTGVNTFNMLVMKNYFAALPAELEESAWLDGANDWTIFRKIALPVSTPILATFFLFYAVDRWNEWWNAMLFLQDRTLYTLQLVLREMIVNTEIERNASMMDRHVVGLAVKSAAIVVTTVPIMLVYPFLQKYFAKGLLIGAIKS